MKTLLALPLLLAATPALAQSKPSDKLPPANPLPYEDSDASAVLAPINAMFAAFAAGDAQAVLAQAYRDGRVTAVGPTPDGGTGIRAMSFAEFATRIKPDTTFEERITDPAIDLDGDIAMVWAPFTVRVAGKLASCGFDHFDLVRENGVWKVMNVTFSSRTTGCR